MKRKILIITLFIILIISIIYIIQLNKKNQISNISDTDKYESLLAMFPKENQGYGLDTYAEGYTHQAMSYGLILSSESIRYQSKESEEGKERIKNATKWLIENYTGDNQDPGWGIAAKWDAFSDGTENPANQSYTITTAVVIQGLLDALQTNAYNISEREEILSVIQEVFDYYLINAWSDTNQNSGYFWYSTNENDNIFTVNVSSAFLGILSRYYNEQNDSISNKDFYLKRINAAAQGVIASVILEDSIPSWYYTAKSERKNDLVHQAYTLHGIELYRDNINQINIPWSIDDAIISLNLFWKDNNIYYFPQNILYSGKEEQFNTRPANLWGVGMMLGLYSNWGEYEKAEQTMESILKEYGDLPDLTMYPLEYLDDETFYTRHASHVLWGMSNYIYNEVK